MTATEYWLHRSDKTGLVSEEGYIVGRGTKVFLRILGREPSWQIMTATASEDDGKIRVFPDRARLLEAAFKIGHRRNTQPISKTDLRGREYVQICRLHHHAEQSADDFDRSLDDFTREFFDIFDEQNAEGEAQVRDEMIEIYHSLSSGDLGEDVYLSDGVWLSSDGSIEDRGR